MRTKYFLLCQDVHLSQTLKLLKARLFSYFKYKKEHVFFLMPYITAALGVSLVLRCLSQLTNEFLAE